MTDPRLLRAQQIRLGEDAISPLAPGTYRVRSQSGRGSYTVRVEGARWNCECPDWLERHLSCKHIFAVVEHLADSAGHPLPTPPGVAPPKRRTYAQDWPAYDAAQQAEHLLFDPYLRDLLSTVPTLLHTGRPGRRPFPLPVQLFCAIRKVHFQESSRRARGLLALTNASHGLLPSVPSYATPSRIFNKATTLPLLTELVTLSALPLAPLEEGGTVGVDSTGFCTTCRGAYCTERYAPQRTHEWIKAHLSAGLKTHVVLAARVTDERGGDSPFFLPLLKKVQEAGFRPRKVVGDKAYLSRDNYEGAAALGFDPFIPFKSDSTGRTGGSPIWRKKFYEFQRHREEFDSAYNLRQNEESANSAIKRKLGEHLLSKNQLAQFNELLAKLLAYNIGVLIHEVFEPGIDPGVPGIKLPPPPGPVPTVNPNAIPLPPIAAPLALPAPALGHISSA